MWELLPGVLFMLTSVYVLPRDKTLALNPNTTRERLSRSYMRLLHVRCRPFHPSFTSVRLCCRRSPCGGQLLPATFLYAAPKFLSLVLHQPALTSAPTLSSNLFCFRSPISLVQSVSYALTSHALQARAFTRLA